VTAPLRKAGSVSKFVRRDAKRDFVIIAALNFASKIGTPDQTEARYRLETAACELAMAEREVAAPTPRARRKG